MTTPNIRSVFDRELLTIRDDIVRMGSLVDQAIERAFTALKTHDLSLAQSVVNDDQVINDLRYKVEHSVTSQLALQQPMAHDLRSLVASLIVCNELERMGDHAEGIARTILRDETNASVAIPTPLSDLADHVRLMLRRSMDDFLAENAERAAETARMDDRADKLYRMLFDTVAGKMCETEMPVEQGMYLLWAGHNLERIGDRVTNICERVIFKSTGLISRGMNPKAEDPAGPA